MSSDTLMSRKLWALRERVGERPGTGICGECGHREDVTMTISVYNMMDRGWDSGWVAKALAEYGAKGLMWTSDMGDPPSDDDEVEEPLDDAECPMLDTVLHEEEGNQFDVYLDYEETDEEAEEDRKMLCELWATICEEFDPKTPKARQFVRKVR